MRRYVDRQVPMDGTIVLVTFITGQSFQEMVTGDISFPLGHHDL